VTLALTAPLGPVRTNVDGVRRPGYMSRENVALIVLVRLTPVAPFAGVVDETVGAAGEVAAVVNDQLTGAADSGTPSEAVMPAPIVAV
jgi:hypothetical protein